MIGPIKPNGKIEVTVGNKVYQVLPCDFTNISTLPMVSEYPHADFTQLFKPDILCQMKQLFPPPPVLYGPPIFVDMWPLFNKMLEIEKQLPEEFEERRMETAEGLAKDEQRFFDGLAKTQMAKWAYGVE